MIIGKYFKSNRDFINLMRVCKKYEELVSMYKFNPISDTTLFENIQTQHFYKNEDIYSAKKGMYRYVFWGHFLDCHKKYIREVNDKKLKYKYNKYDDKAYIRDKLISKFNEENAINKTLINTPYDLEENIFDSNTVNYAEKYDDLGWKVFVKANDYILVVYEDKYNNFICSIGKSRPDTFPVKLSFNKCQYFNNNGIQRAFENNTTDYKIKSSLLCNDLYFKNCDHVVVVTNFEKDNRTGKYSFKMLFTKNVTSLSFDGFENFMFSTDMNEVSSSKNNDTFKIKSVKVFRLKFRYEYRSDYYNELLMRNDLNIIYDTWKEFERYNLTFGFMRYIYIDQNKNYVIYNVLPTEIVITVKSSKGIVVYKPLVRMINFIMNINYISFKRYDWESLDGYYSLPTYEMLSPLGDFKFNRLLLATNEFTNCSCVKMGKYYMHVDKGSLTNY
jgi:hypothetical protein